MKYRTLQKKQLNEEYERRRNIVKKNAVNSYYKVDNKMT